MADARSLRLRPAVLALAALLSLGASSAALAQGAADTVSREDFIVSRTRLDAEADHLRRGRWVLTDDTRRERRELSEEAQRVHDDAKTVGETDAAGMTRLTGTMDELRARIEDFMERAETATEGGRGRKAEPLEAPAAEPAAMPEPPPPPDPADMRPIVVITRYNDLLQDALWVSDGLSATERDRVDALREEGDGLSRQLRKTAQRKHEEREASVERLYEIGTELRGIYDLGNSNRRRGLPLVEAGRTTTGWTVAGIASGPFEVLRTRFIRPGSAYVTVRNASDEPRPYAISLDFSDAVGDSTGTGAWVSRPLEDLAPGEVREVLVAIAPAVDRFWDVTTDYTVSVQ